jgi:UDP-N-acetylglucosamine 2-epimerase (non-hydrolysing)
MWGSMPRKILTILGTRPEIIRLSQIMPKLDARCDHRVLHTGQNYDARLNDIFFQELGLRAPDHVLHSQGTLAQQLSATFVGVEQYLQDFDPDAVLVLGDTNSGLSAVICERMGYPVFHMEAGNRCYDDLVPEEKNRRVIDHVSTFNLPYTELSRQNLLREGLANQRVLVTGNPIREVLDAYSADIQRSDVLARLNLTPGQYVVATAHRAENVDNPQLLASIVAVLEHVAKDCPVIFSCHPKTQQRLGAYVPAGVVMLQPLGFIDWARLERDSRLAITDSGTVQEEMCLFHKPTITIRATTERPETVSCGSNIVAGLDFDRILDCYQQAMNLKCWQIPEEYARTNVSDTVINIILGNHV